MRSGARSDPALPPRGCGSPEPRPGSAQRDPLERLLAHACLEDQKARRETKEELRKDCAYFSAVIAAQHQIAASQLSFDQALELIAGEAREITKAGGAAIALRDGTKVLCHARSGLLAPGLGSELDPQSGLSGACLRTGQVQHCDDTETDQRVDMWVCRSLGVRSILAVPLRREQDVVGILEVFSGWAGVFGERDIRTLKLLGGLVIESLWSADMQQVGPPPAKSLVPVAPDAASDILVVSVPVPPVVDDGASASAETAVAEIAPIEADVVSPAIAMAVNNHRKRMVQAIALAAAVLVIVTSSLMWRSAHATKTPTMAASSTSGNLLPGTARETLPPGTAVGQTEIAAGTPGPATVLSVRHWSKPEGTTIGILLNGPVRWDSGELNPRKIFFDLTNAQLPRELLGKAKQGTTIAVNDGLVQRVRVGLNPAGSARVVIELAGVLEHSAMLSPESYGLMIAIPRPGNATNTATAELNPPAPTQFSESGRKRAAAHAGLRIVVDPGHGGSEDGAIGHAGLKEKDLVLGIARRLGELLANRLGAEVIYTRTDDRNVPLEMRAVMANEAGADLFVSVHANYSNDAAARGVETYYVDRSSSPVELAIAARENSSHKGTAVARVSDKQKLTESRKLAADVQQALFGVFGGERGVLNRGVKQAPFLVLLDAEMPSILAEVAFVSSPTDEQKLNTAEGQEAAAEGLYRGIARYVASAKRDKVVASLSANRGQ